MNLTKKTEKNGYMSAQGNTTCLFNSPVGTFLDREKNQPNKQKTNNNKPKPFRYAIILSYKNI